MARLLFSRLFFCYIICLIGCTIDSIGVKKNGQIDKNDREKIKDIRESIYLAFKEKNANGIKKLYTSSLKNGDLSSTDSMVANVDVSDHVIALPVAAEFIVYNSPTTNINEVQSELGGYKYIYQFKPIGKETYVCLFYMPNYSEKNDWLVTTTFNKENDQWMLTTITVGPMTCNNQIAPYHYLKAENYWQENKWLPAAFYSLVTMRLALPAFNNFHYLEEKEMSEFTRMVIDSANRKLQLPHKINLISTKPEMMGFEPTIYKGVLYPLVIYNSEVKFKDSLSIKVENENLHKIIDNVFPDVYDIGDEIVYRIFNNYNTTEYVEILKHR